MFLHGGGDFIHLFSYNRYYTVNVIKEGECMAYKAIDVARYIVNQFNSPRYAGYSVSNMKLQKLLYLVQAFFLIKRDGEPCFDDQIKAWAFGPVVPAVYHEFKCYGNLPIPEIKSYVVPDPSAPMGVRRIRYQSHISADDREIIDAVLDAFKGWSAIELMNLTHDQKPWIDAYADGKSTNDHITNGSILRFFKEELHLNDS